MTLGAVVVQKWLNASAGAGLSDVKKNPAGFDDKNLQDRIF
jgi:hypothetical protein